ncbi:HTH domain-containing protein [Streptomyces sp. FXJ1.4098]|nr:HTH domain-containing protein [Streptomyces sp. FXJ1.4098]
MGEAEDMRADRLIATLLLLQSRGRVTAAELADELEVSVATARRDLEALSAAGVPVYPSPDAAAAGRSSGAPAPISAGFRPWRRRRCSCSSARPRRSRPRPRRRCASSYGRCRRPSAPTPRQPPLPP